MTSYEISQLTALTDPATDDLIVAVDVSDHETAPAGSAGSDKKLTIADLLDLVPSGGTLTQYIAPEVVTLSYASTIEVNAEEGNAFDVTLTGNATFANPTNPVASQVIRFHVTQDSTGSRTAAWGTAYNFGSGSAPTLSTAAGKLDIIAFEYDAGISEWCYLGAGLGY